MIDDRDDDGFVTQVGPAMAVEPFDISPWSGDFVTGVGIMDAQHQMLMQLLNDLSRKLVLQTSSPSCDEVLRALGDYATDHFAAEERLIRQVLPGDILEHDHLQAHQDFAVEVGRLREQAATLPESEGSEKVIAFVSHWLAHHILDADRRMAMVILAVQAGTPLAEAKAQAERAMSGAFGKVIAAVPGMYASLASRTLQLMKEVVERKRGEDILRVRDGSLHEQKVSLAAVFENALDAVVVMNSAGVITGWNSQAEKTFGWSRQEAIGRRWLVFPQDAVWVF